MTSHYHGSKILDRQDHLHRRTMDEKYGIWYGSCCSHVQERYTRHVFHYLQDHVCLDPEILLPWQCDTTTSLADTLYKESVEPKLVSHGCLSFR